MEQVKVTVISQDKFYDPVLDNAIELRKLKNMYHAELKTGATEFNSYLTAYLLQKDAFSEEVAFKKTQA